MCQKKWCIFLRFRFIARNFERETRNICFAAGVKDKTELLGRQISFLMSNHIQCVGQVERYLEKDQDKITKLDTQITDLSAEIQHKKIVAAAVGRYFGKHKFGGYEDEVVAVNRGYGKATKPEDYIDEFRKFITENINKIAVLNIVCNKPSELTRAALKELSRSSTLE